MRSTQWRNARESVRRRRSRSLRPGIGRFAGIAVAAGEIHVRPSTPPWAGPKTCFSHGTNGPARPAAQQRFERLAAAFDSDPRATPSSNSGKAPAASDAVPLA
jgi:hypothetical protein